MRDMGGADEQKYSDEHDSDTDSGKEGTHDSNNDESSEDDRPLSKKELKKQMKKEAIRSRKKLLQIEESKADKKREKSKRNNPGDLLGRQGITAALRE